MLINKGRPRDVISKGSSVISPTTKVGGLPRGLGGEDGIAVIRSLACSVLSPSRLQGDALLIWPTQTNNPSENELDRPVWRVTPGESSAM